MRLTRRWAVATACSAALVATTPALAVGTTPGAPVRTAPQHHVMTPASKPAAPDFSGTAALSDCSAAVVRWQTSLPTDKALVLTNGHCYGDTFLRAHQVVVNQPAVRSVTLLNSDGSTAGTVSTVRVLYATMSRTDVALYQLNETYQDLQDQYAVPALTIASTKPAPNNEPIEVLSGYWKIAYDCNLHGFAYRLLEYVWTWRESLRYSDGGCQVIGGTSGSPVLDANRNEIGINNTINEDGERCTLDNPCEENRAGKISVHEDRGYGQETWVFYTCLSDNQIDLAKSGCRLPRP